MSNFIGLMDENDNDIIIRESEIAAIFNNDSLTTVVLKCGKLLRVKESPYTVLAYIEESEPQ